MSAVFLGHVTTPSGKLILLDPQLSIGWSTEDLDRANDALRFSQPPLILTLGANGEANSIVVNGLPHHQKFAVHGELIDEGLFAGRFRRIRICIESTARVARTETVEGVRVEHRQLMCADLDSLSEFRMWEPADGLADYVVRGRDDAVIAHLTDAPEVFDEDGYGWKNIPLAKIESIANQVSSLVSEKDYQVSVEYRPHCNLEKLNAQIRESETQSGELQLGSSLACGFRNRWGDGVFPVCCDYDAQERLVGVSIDVGNEKHQSLMRQVYQRHQTAIVTNRVWNEGAVLRVAQRYESSHPGDSGWFFSAGTEDQHYLQDPSHFQIVTVKEVIERYAETEAILDAEIDARFRRQGSGFIAD